MAAGRVQSATLSIANSMCSLCNLAIPLNVAFLAVISTVMSTRECGSVDCRTRIIVREWKFIAPYHYSVFAMQHDLLDLNLA
jgi:hypothetical protein